MSNKLIKPITRLQPIYAPLASGLYMLYNIEPRISAQVSELNYYSCIAITAETMILENYNYSEHSFFFHMLINNN